MISTDTPRRSSVQLSRDAVEESMEEVDFLRKRALRRIQRFDNRCVAQSAGVDNKGSHLLPPLSLRWNDIEVGQLIGRGSFSTVRKAYIKNDPEDIAYALKSPMSITFKRKSNDNSNGGSSNKNKTQTGIIDLLVEAKILSLLSHKNIIQLKGVNDEEGCSLLLQSSGYHPTTPDSGPFMLVEMLVETLDKRIERWREEELPLWNRRRGGRAFKRRCKERVLSCLQTTAIGIARGMEYLHKQGVIFRDLKPQNVGFAEDGTVKIFDFGLARGIGAGSSCSTDSFDSSSSDNSNDVDDDTWSLQSEQKLTGNCGTPRYMAPEVGGAASSHGHGGHQRQYGLPADVYSFAILLWEVLTLKKPFANIDTLAGFHRHVYHHGSRPSLKYIPSNRLRNLLGSSWDKRAAFRPTFSTICTALEKEEAHLLMEEQEDLHQTAATVVQSTKSRARTVVSRWMSWGADNEETTAASERLPSQRRGPRRLVRQMSDSMLSFGCRSRRQRSMVRSESGPSRSDEGKSRQLRTVAASSARNDDRSFHSMASFVSALMEESTEQQRHADTASTRSSDDGFCSFHSTTSFVSTLRRANNTNSRDDDDIWECDEHENIEYLC